MTSSSSSSSPRSTAATEASLLEIDSRAATAFAAGKARAAKKSAKRAFTVASLTLSGNNVILDVPNAGQPTIDPVDLASYSVEAQDYIAHRAAQEAAYDATRQVCQNTATDTAPVVTESPAPAVPVLPEVPAGATHYRLTRSMLELASSVKTLAADLAALGQRDGDKLEFGTLTAAGTFTTSAKALSGPKAPRPSNVIMHEAEILPMLDGTKTVLEIAQAIVAIHGGDVKAVSKLALRTVKRAKRKGTMAKDAKPFAPAARAPKVTLTPEEKAAAKLAKKVAAARALLATVAA